MELTRIPRQKLSSVAPAARDRTTRDNRKLEETREEPTGSRERERRETAIELPGKESKSHARAFPVARFAERAINSEFAASTSIYFIGPKALHSPARSSLRPLPANDGAPLDRPEERARGALSIDQCLIQPALSVRERSYIRRSFSLSLPPPRPFNSLSPPSPLLSRR